MSAELAVVDVLYVGGKSAQQVGGKSAQFEHWNKSPDSVLFDGRISFAARCVYATLAGSCHGAATATIGQRRIAELLKAHKETILLALRELEKVGHIESTGSGKTRRVYWMRAGVASGSKTSSAPPKVGSTAGQRLIKPSAICSRCHKPRPALLRIGICRSCNLDLKLDRKVIAAVDKRLRATA